MEPLDVYNPIGHLRKGGYRYDEGYYFMDSHCEHAVLMGNSGQH